ncbi:MAG: MFS transporter [Caldilineaceae bacterium]
MLSTLRQRNFALLWSGQIISRMGDWVLWIALPFYVYEKSGSALATGAMFIVTNLPPLLFASLAGVFVDRWNRKQVMVAADLLRALLILLLLLIRSSDYLWLLYPLAFGEAMISQFFTPAKSAILPTLVDQRSLTAANTLISISGDVAMLIGPACSGLLYGSLGFTGVVWIDAVSFVFSALLIGSIQLPTEPRKKTARPVDATHPRWMDGKKLWLEWQDGLRIVQRERTIATLFITAGLAYIGNGIILVSWYVHVREVLGGGALEYGWIQVAVATGGILAGLGMTRLYRCFSARQLMALSGIITGFLLFATFHLHSIPLILFLQVLTGIAAVGFYVPMSTLLQSSTEKEFLGRIFGAFGTTCALLMLLGQGIASLFVARLGTTWMLDGAALMALLGGVYALRLPVSQETATSTSPPSATPPP